ncbi:PQQ-binding-like beta-propeller repeat protein [Rhodococcus sp. I2R]|uniref:outer membrane protein assembly factor BamB family protein n=1 Tax=Rhodococcus sp. I2R TaxID=2855445 RepID=UPI001E54DFFC|nr:PQQ-binding-like beta-propeller repeat protein [Rhodococcus sp. I2R]MCC8930545.1 PQQ-like beta-propeller repeat protein [Rhodococcus sp. I2R]
MKPGTQLAVAAVVAVVTVSGAAVVLTKDRTTTIKRITDASAAAPGVAWSVDVSVSGLDGAVFADPRTGSMFSWGANSIRIDELLLTLAVVPDDLTTSNAVMLAIDADTGGVRWRAPAVDLAACAEEPLDGQLVCQVPSFGERPGLTTFDLETGTSRHFDTDPYLFATTVANGSLYLAEGSLEDADVRLHRGTLEDYDADWSVPLGVRGSWEEQYADQLKVGPETGHLDLTGSFTTFDAQTGTGLWSTDVLDDCVIAQYRTAGDLAVATNFDCDGSSSDVTGTTAYSGDGEVLATYEGPAEHYLAVDEPADASVPVVLGDTAFDRATGEELWSSELLVFDRPADEWNEARTVGTLTAVVDHIGIASCEQQTVGIDLHSGEQLWTSEDRIGSILARDGDAVLISKNGELSAVDVRTGTQLWSAEFSNMLAEESTSMDTYVDGGDGTYFLQTGSALARLDPLPG